MRRLVVITAIAWIVSAAAVAADDQLSQHVTRLDDWRTAVGTHEPGEADASLERIADWNNAAIKQLWLDAQTLFMFVHCTGCGAPTVIGLDGRRYGSSYSKSELLELRSMAGAIRERQESDELLKRAAILHADIVMLANPQGEPHVEPPLPLPVPGQKRSGGTAAPE